MKSFAVMIIAILVPWTSFAWVPQMQFFITPQYAQVQVANTTPFNAFCEGSTYGVTPSGHYVQTWFSSFIPPYGYQYSYVYANGPYIFVNAGANIHCQH
jgi:hypothetical protein